MVKLAGYDLRIDPAVRWQKRQQGVMACFALAFVWGFGCLGICAAMFFENGVLDLALAVAAIIAFAACSFVLIKWQEPRIIPPHLSFPWRMLIALPVWVIMAWVASKTLIPTNYHPSMNSDFNPALRVYVFLLFPPFFIAISILWNFRQQLILLLAVFRKETAPAGEHGTANLQGAADLAASGFVGDEGGPPIF